MVTEYCILPLGSETLHEGLPHIKSVLLYGPPQCGKSMLAQAVAWSTGSNFFDITPKNTDGKYTGKQVSLMIHMVFKVARIMQPSVIFIDECEKVFIMDKKKAKEFGGIELCNRIKKEMLKEVKAM